MGYDSFDLGREGDDVGLIADARRRKRQSRRAALCLVGLLVVAAVVVTGLAIGESLREEARGGAVYYRHAAVATDVGICSDLAVAVMQRDGGNAVDAAVTATLCVGLVNAQSSGIGGGGFMVLRDAKGNAEVIDFREEAPALATERMYSVSPLCTSKDPGETKQCPSQYGGLAVAVPSELKGLELAWKRHGRVPWATLVKPVAELARTGWAVSEYTAEIIQSSLDLIKLQPPLAAIYAPDGVPLKVGDTLRRPTFAATLDRIAAEGAAAFYSGPIAQNIVTAASDQGGILTLADLDNYQPIIRDVVHTSYHGREVLSAPPPASGVVMSMALNILDGYKEGSKRTSLAEHRMVEAFKFAYAMRTRLADPCCAQDSVPHACRNATACKEIETLSAQLINTTNASEWRSRIQDDRTHDPTYYGGHYDVTPSPGTTHLSVVGPDGDAVALTSTVNLHFGSKVMTADGILLNNEMDDFSSPNITNAFGVEPSPANFIRPGKRPLSSSAPCILLEGGHVKLVAGAAGGTTITTATLQVVRNTLQYGDSIEEAVNRPRIHHQLIPNHVRGETSYPNTFREQLEKIGHKWEDAEKIAVTQAVLTEARGITAASDKRKGGYASGY